MPAVGANPQHVPIPLSAAWRGRVSLGRLDSAKSCSAVRDGETAPRTTATKQGEERLQKPHVGPSAHSCAAALASPPVSPCCACARPHRSGKGSGFRQTMGPSPGCCQRLLLGSAAGCHCPLLPCPTAGGPAGPPRNFLPVSAHHILFSPRRARILGCVSPILPH